MKVHLVLLIGLGVLYTASARTRYVRETMGGEGSGLGPSAEPTGPSQEQLAVDQIRKVMEIAEEEAAKAAAIVQDKTDGQGEKKKEDDKKKDEIKPVVPPTAVKNATKEDKIMEELSKDQLIPDKAIPAAAAANVTSEDESVVIKEENVEKCNKCLKPTYKFRHGGFCGKCSNQGVIDPEEADDLAEAINCKKCLKPKFRARNEDLCNTTCADEVAAAAAEAAANKKPSSSGIKFGTTDMSPDDDAEKGIQEVTMTTTVPETTTESEEARLGPLGNLIKYLVVQNTWL